MVMGEWSVICENTHPKWLWQRASRLGWPAEFCDCFRLDNNKETTSTTKQIWHTELYQWKRKRGPTLSFQRGTSGKKGSNVKLERIQYLNNYPITGSVIFSIMPRAIFVRLTLIFRQGYLSLIPFFSPYLAESFYLTLNCATLWCFQGKSTFILKLQPRPIISGKQTEVCFPDVQLSVLAVLVMIN